MIKLNVEKLLDDIKNGRKVESRYSGWVYTPKIPDEVFTIVTKSNGEEFKRYLTEDKFIPWIETIAANSLNPEADIKERAIASTHFTTMCENCYRDIERRKSDICGFTWLENGNPYSVSLQGEESIERAKNAFASVVKNAIPVSCIGVYNGQDQIRAADRRRELEEARFMGGDDR